MSGILRLEDARPKAEGFWLYTQKYGETKSVLTRDIEEGSPKETGRYLLSVPEEVTQICREVKSLGGRALLVGGCVRDMIISKEFEGVDLKPKDFDLEVYGLMPSDLIKVLGLNYDLKVRGSVVGKSYQVINIYIKGWDEPINVSIPRADAGNDINESGCLEASAGPWMNICEAAQMRDITINTGAYDPLTGVLYDPLGVVEAVKRRTIDVTDEKLFRKDALRVYRIMQFAGRFEFDVAPKTVELCRTMVERGDLDGLSKNRITTEFKKLLLKGERPSLGLRFALETGIVARYWPEFKALVGLEQEKEWHPEKDVWEHSLQVLDAAALIADRENLDDNQRTILLLSALCHDLGKATTTKFEDGRIRSRGHEEAGVEPTLRFLKSFSPPEEPASGFSLEIRKAVSVLVKNHLKPKYYWKEEIENNKDMTNAIRRMARELGENGTSLYILSLLAEADQRGRSENGYPKEREEVDELVAWQLWFAEKSMENEIMESAPENICTSRMVMDQDPDKGGGVQVGVVMECVYQDQLDGLVIDEVSAEEKARYYYPLLREKVISIMSETGKDEITVWREFRKAEDPRLYANCVI